MKTLTLSLAAMFALTLCSSSASAAVIVRPVRPVVRAVRPVAVAPRPVIRPVVRRARVVTPARVSVRRHRNRSR